MPSGATSDIRFLSRTDLDADAYGNCIARSQNGLIYARPYYLDAMSKNWGALVLNDYDAVMPLTWNRKYAIKYLYQPPFTAQLGIFSPAEISPQGTHSFLIQCQKYFRFCEIHLNQANRLAGITERANYILSLHNSYEQIREGFQKNLLRNLNRVTPGSLRYSQADDYRQIIAGYQDLYGKRFPGVRQSDYDRFSGLCSELLQKGQLLLREVRDSASGERLAAAIFLFDDNRIYNIMPVTFPGGREKQANGFLLDRLIAEFANKNLTLDFEGSELPGIAAFYQKFGSRPESYPFFRFNHLPFPLRLFK